VIEHWHAPRGHSQTDTVSDEHLLKEGAARNDPLSVGCACCRDTPAADTGGARDHVCGHVPDARQDTQVRCFITPSHSPSSPANI
jgi:hypothetical protein